MPWLEIHRDRSLTLPRLVHVSSRGVIDAQHRNDTIGRAVGALDVRPLGAHVRYVHTDSARPLGDLRRLSYRSIDAVDTVAFVCDEKTTAHLWSRRTGVEQSRCRVREQTIRQVKIRLVDAREIGSVDPYRHAHEQVLRRLDDVTIDALQIPLLERFQTKIAEIEVAVGNDRILDLRGDVDDLVRDHTSGAQFAHSGEERTRTDLLQVRGDDSRREHFIVRMLSDQANAYLGTQGVDLMRVNPIIHLRRHLVGDARTIDGIR